MGTRHLLSGTSSFLLLYGGVIVPRGNTEVSYTNQLKPSFCRRTYRYVSSQITQQQSNGSVAPCDIIGRDRRGNPCSTSLLERSFIVDGQLEPPENEDWPGDPRLSSTRAERGHESGCRWPREERNTPTRAPTIAAPMSPELPLNDPVLLGD